MEIWYGSDHDSLPLIYCWQRWLLTSFGFMEIRNARLFSTIRLGGRLSEHWFILTKNEFYLFVIVWFYEMNRTDCHLDKNDDRPFFYFRLSSNPIKWQKIDDRQQNPTYHCRVLVLKMFGNFLELTVVLCYTARSDGLPLRANPYSWSTAKEFFFSSSDCRVLLHSRFVLLAHSQSEAEKW